MPKQLTEEHVTKAADKAAAAATKTTLKSATDAIKAEAERIKSSDLGRAEKRAALDALNNVKTAVKS